MNNSTEQELLLKKVVDGSLTEDDHRQLDSMVASDATFAKRLTRYMMTDHLLDKYFLDNDQPDFSLVHATRTIDALDRPPTNFVFRLLLLSSTLVLGLVLCAAGFVLYCHSAENNLAIATRPMPENNTAQIVRMRGVQWEDSNNRFKEWDVLDSGRSLQFTKGSVEIFFSRDVHIILEGPADMTIVNSTLLNVKKGRVMARVGQKGYGFTINTPTGRIVDLGTEFGVDVDTDDKVNVLVYDGKVDVFPDQSGKVSMRQGEGITMKKTGGIVPIKMIEAGHFLESAMPRPSFDTIPQKVIVSVGDNIRSPDALKFYEIVPGGFNEDALAYVDRSHEWNGVDNNGLPACLLGGDYIRTFNNDRYETDYRMTIELAVPANLYVLLDRRGPAPEWLATEFTKTDLVVGIDEVWSSRPGHDLESLKRDWKVTTEARLKEVMNMSYHRRGSGSGDSIDNKFDVWKKEVSQPGKVVLGAPKSEYYGNQYGIVAVPLSQ